MGNTRYRTYPTMDMRGLPRQSLLEGGREREEARPRRKTRELHITTDHRRGDFNLNSFLDLLVHTVTSIITLQRTRRAHIMLANTLLPVLISCNDAAMGLAAQ